MSERNEHNGLGERLADAYHRMLERVRGQQQEHGIDSAIDRAQERAAELGELSREEAQRVADYLRRDLHDAASFLERSGSELRQWLAFDLELVERSLLDLFGSVVDQSRVELANWRMRGELGEWHSGEVAAMGTLECRDCGERITFQKAGRIPPCPRCHGTRYRRVSDGG